MILKLLNKQNEIIKTNEIDERSFVNTIRTQLSEKYMVTNLPLLYYRNTSEGLECRLNTKLNIDQLHELDKATQKECELYMLDKIAKYEKHNELEIHNVKKFYDMNLELEMGASEDFVEFLEDIDFSEVSLIRLEK